MKKKKRFVSANEFSKWINNDFLKENSSYSWIKQVSSKSVKQSIYNAEKAYKRFFKKQAKFPKFKKKTNTNVKMYLPKNNKTDWTIERHRIKIPTLSWVRLKEFGYIPNDSIVKSGTVSKQADRYFISVLCDLSDEKIKDNNNSQGIGIDLGIKKLAICSDKSIYKNINKTKKIKKIEKKLKREQKSLSRKLLKKNKEVKTANIKKNKIRVQKIHMKLSNIRTEYVRWVVNSIIKANNLQFIAIEDLNIKGMLKNRHLSKAIQKQNFYYFKLFLIQQCKKHNIEVRMINRWYPSSKLCNNCGQIKENLKLSDRIYKCDCGYTEDRDLNASYNIRDCEDYKIV